MKFTDAVITIAIAMVGVATLAVIVSPKSQTSSVLSAFGSVFSGALRTVTQPVT